MHRDSGCVDLAPKAAEDQRQCERRACHPHTLTKPRCNGSISVESESRDFRPDLDRLVIVRCLALASCPLSFSLVLAPFLSKSNNSFIFTFK